MSEEQPSNSGVLDAKHATGAGAVRLLFVDDDGPTRRMLARQLRSKGYLVDTAGNAAEALQLAQQCAYAMVGIDLWLPDLDGIALSRALHRLHPETAHVLITGDPTAKLEDLQSAEDSFCDVIHKPWAPEQLQEVVDGVVQEFRARRPGSARSVPPDKKVTEVLVVEDDETDFMVVQRYLSKYDDKYRVTRASNMQEAVTLLTEGNFGAVLCDLSLPDSRGAHTVSRLREIVPQLPLLVLSGSDEEEMAVAAVQLGAQDYLIKGAVNPESIHRAIRYAVERRRAEDNLIYLAHFDQLTKLANRTLFRDRLENALGRAKRQGHKVALCYVDLDNFKMVNDTYGHEAGDHLLQETAGRLVSSVRISDTVSRLSGDEFGLLLDFLPDASGAVPAAERIINSFATPVCFSGQQLPVTPSVGIALYPDDSEGVDGLLRAADWAMYQAKRGGRNQFKFYSSRIEREETERLALEAALRQAVEQEDFVLHYQPQPALGGEPRMTMEALLRWQRGDKLVPPLDFIPVLERTGMIVPVGRFIIHSACEQLRAWKDAGLEHTAVAVNLSAKQLSDPDLADTIQSALAKFDLRGEDLELEITESAVMEDVKTAVGLLEQLKETGCQIAIDDFGTGYSSLAYLRKLPVDTLKIDRTFVMNCPDDEDDRTIAELIICLAKALKLEVVAEGVETAAQLEFLRDAGCDRAQGYFLSRPLAAPALHPWLLEHCGPQDSAVA